MEDVFGSRRIVLVLNLIIRIGLKSNFTYLNLQILIFFFKSLIFFCVKNLFLKLAEKRENNDSGMSNISVSPQIAKLKPFLRRRKMSEILIYRSFLKRNFANHLF